MTFILLKRQIVIFLIEAVIGLGEEETLKWRSKPDTFPLLVGLTVYRETQWFPTDIHTDNCHC